jgi:peptidoglycan/LPS O-acetylase OafA/YrhL
LRGLAALMVALSHFVLAFQPALLGGGPAVSHFAGSVAISHTAAIVLFNPELGVAVFFVLSGYVLAASAARSRASLARLVLRRWLRLALPVLGTSLLIWPLAEWHLFRSVEVAGLARSDWLAGNYAWLAFESNDLARLVWQSLVDLFARGAHFYNAALWTMPVEFRGSVGLFAMAAMLRWVPGAGSQRQRRRAWLALAMSVGTLGLVWKSAYFGFPCGVALFAAERLLPPRRDRPGVGLVLLATGLVLGGTPYLVDLAFDGPYARLFLALAPFMDNPVLFLHRVAAVCLVASAMIYPPLRALLVTQMAQYLGRISFMLYLVHVPIICSLCAALCLWLTPVIGYNHAVAVVFVAFINASIATATLCNLVIDEPILRILRKDGSIGARSGFETFRIFKKQPSAP